MKKQVDIISSEELLILDKAFKNALKPICIIKVDGKIDVIYANNSFKKLLNKYQEDYHNLDNFKVESANYDKYVKCAYNNVSLNFYSFFSKSQFVCNITCYNYKYGYVVVEVNDESSDTLFDIYVSKLFSNYTEVYFIDLDKDYYENIFSKYKNFKERGIYTDIIKKNFTEETVENPDLKDVLYFLNPLNIKSNLMSRKSIDLKYKRINEGWYLITIVPFNSKGNDKIILTIRSIDEVLQTENKDKKRYLLASKAKSRFLSRISHDVKTPISNILQICDNLKQTNIDSYSLDMIDKISSSSMYLLTLLSDYLDLGKIEAGKILTRISKCDFVKLCDNIYNFICQIAYNYNVKVEYKCDIENRYCLCDEAKILRSIVNVLTNAIKYSKKSDKTQIVYFNVFERCGYYEVTIKDNGIGITKDKIDDIFEEYERINENSYIKGSGVGLQIVKRFVEAMGGVILVSSNKDITQFSLHFDLEITEEIESNEDCYHTKYENKRILVCEDNPINIEVLKAMLDKLNIKYDIVSCGNDAIDLFKNSKYNFYNLILMDIILPDISGYEVSDIIKGLNRSDTNIPIVSMSANSYEEDILESKKHKMVEHLNKPIDYNNLRVILNRYLRK